MTRPLRVLCLDIEGGHGGSSRSLYYLLKHVDRDAVAPTVWCRRDGPIMARYAEIAIPVVVEPGLPKASALPRASRNVAQLMGHAGEFWRARGGALERLADAASAHDIVHFNHEGFAALAWWLRRTVNVPATMHIRTNVLASAFARAQMRAISRAVDAVAFITPNEERTFRGLGGMAPGRVIYNVVESDARPAPHDNLVAEKRLKIASLSNAAHVRGTDRLIDIAAALKALGRRDVVIVAAGDMHLGGRWPAPYDAFARDGKTLADVAAAQGLADYFLFLGHVPDPERVLAGADLLLKPTREDNPWGRDVLEALAAGCPVISVGSDATFVETGVTGMLQPRFDADAAAQAIAVLADDRASLASMGEAARARVAKLCNGPGRARELTELWRDAVARHGA